MAVGVVSVPLVGAGSVPPSLPVKRMVATVLFTDATGRVLVVEPTYKPGFELPGGAVEDGESPREGARREVGEELGLDCQPGRLLALDYVPATGERAEGVVAVFDGGVVEGAWLVLPADELRGYAFVEVDRLGEFLPALLARRAAAALAARRSGATCCLEFGYDAAG